MGNVRPFTPNTTLTRRFFSLSLSMFFLFRNDLYAAIFVSFCVFLLLFSFCFVRRAIAEWECFWVKTSGKKYESTSNGREKSANTHKNGEKRIRPFLHIRRECVERDKMRWHRNTYAVRCKTGASVKLVVVGKFKFMPFR